MTGRTLNWYWKAMWAFVSPVLIISLFVFYLSDYILTGTLQYQAWDATQVPDVPTGLGNKAEPMRSLHNTRSRCCGVRRLQVTARELHRDVSGMLSLVQQNWAVRPLTLMHGESNSHPSGPFPRWCWFFKGALMGKRQKGGNGFMQVCWIMRCWYTGPFPPMLLLL